MTAIWVRSCRAVTNITRGGPSTSDRRISSETPPGRVELRLCDLAPTACLALRRAPDLAIAADTAASTMGAGGSGRIVAAAEVRSKLERMGFAAADLDRCSEVCGGLRTVRACMHAQPSFFSFSFFLFLCVTKHSSDSIPNSIGATGLGTLPHTYCCWTQCLRSFLARSTI